jgi:5'-nucleotidase
VVVNSFLATGGDNFAVLVQGTDRVGGPVDLDALIAYVGAQPASDVAAPPLGRIALLP